MCRLGFKQTFFEKHLKVESKLLADLKLPVRSHGVTKSAINDLDDILLSFDPWMQARVKDLFHKAANERVKTTRYDQNITETALNLGEDEIEDLPRRKLLKNLENKEK